MAKRRPRFLSRISFSFVSLKRFPLPPLEETAAPATHKPTLTDQTNAAVLLTLL